MLIRPDQEIEPFVAADVAAEFLSIKRRRVLEMARAGQIPAHPIGHGRRKQRRFRLSELADAFAAENPAAKPGGKVLSTSADPGNRIGGDK